MIGTISVMRTINQPPSTIREWRVNFRMDMSGILRSDFHHWCIKPRVSTMVRDIEIETGPVRAIHSEMYSLANN